MKDLSDYHMRNLKRSTDTIRWLVTFIALSVLVACASGAELVDHSFGFNAVEDSSDVQILDYRYGTSKQPGASNIDELRKEGRSFQATSITADMVRGDSLYVKWKIKNT